MLSSKFYKKVIKPIWLSVVVTVAALVIAYGCQNYQFIYQPDIKNSAVHLKFKVQSPSKADILFVIDNSESMGEEQQALKSSISRMLEFLSVQNTQYRIGIISTDTHGFLSDCCGNINPPAPSSVGVSSFQGKGNCHLCSGEDGICNPGVSSCSMRTVINRPHDGSLGRLISAYNSDEFSIDKFSELSDEVKSLLAKVLPDNERDVPYVIDRAEIFNRACSLCQCNLSATEPECDEEAKLCVEQLSASLITAYFKSNLSGLGTSGFGWEQGIKGALLSIGIDPDEIDEMHAVNPHNDLTANGMPNSYWSNGEDSTGSWIRDDAVTAIVFISDEEDCSMPLSLVNLVDKFETESGLPIGSICYQSGTQQKLLSVEKMAELVKLKKTSNVYGVVIGCIGGVNAVAGNYTDGEAADCAINENGLMVSDCACFAGSEYEGSDVASWCAYTQNSGDGDDQSSTPVCDAIAGNRYVKFAEQFARRVMAPICQRQGDAMFADALLSFVAQVTRACFAFNEIKPADDNPDNITLFFKQGSSAAEQQSDSIKLAQTSPDSEQKGWYWDSVQNTVCLTGIDRIVGDEYDIYIITEDELLYNQ